MKRIYASVLITNFNKEKFLIRTLNSCKNQNFKGKEVIIFDDCSTDNSLSVIKKFKNFKLIENKKKMFKSGLSLPFSDSLGLITTRLGSNLKKVG